MYLAAIAPVSRGSRADPPMGRPVSVSPIRAQRASWHWDIRLNECPLLGAPLSAGDLRLLGRGAASVAARSHWRAKAKDTRESFFGGTGVKGVQLPSARFVSIRTCSSRPRSRAVAHRLRIQ